MDNTNEKAIQTLIEQIIKIVSMQGESNNFYDKTVKAIYIEQIDNLNHKIEYSGIEYVVKKTGNKTNRTGDIVLLLIPCNDINNAIILSENNGIDDRDLNLNMFLAESILSKNGVQLPKKYFDKVFELLEILKNNGMDSNYSMFFALLYSVLLLK